MALTLTGLFFFASAPIAVGFFVLLPTQVLSTVWISVLILALCIVYRYGLALLGYRFVSEGRNLWNSVRARASDSEVLYLRSFHADGLSLIPWNGSGTPPGEMDPALAAYRQVNAAIYGSSGIKRFANVLGQTHEGHIAFATRRVGELTFFDNRKEIEPGPHGQRFWVPPANWKRAVLGRIRSARLIVIAGGETESLNWEMQQVRRLAVPEAVLIVFPKDIFGYSRDLYERLRASIELAFATEIPASIAIPDVIGFRRNWEPELIYDRTPLFVRFLFLASWSSVAAGLRKALKIRRLPCRWFPPLGSWIGLLRVLILSLIATEFLALAYALFN